MGVNRSAGASVDVEDPHRTIQYTVVCGRHSPDLPTPQQSSSQKQYVDPYHLNRLTMNLRLSSANNSAMAPSASGPKIQAGKGLVAKIAFPQGV